ncbi:MAG: Primer-independent DNA polymerase PolB [Mycoplasmataceae bacterium]|nr:MAG: Primer-independent DNA polymerase PolB [Mycoplasmataceae bacterium]
MTNCNFTRFSQEKPDWLRINCPQIQKYDIIIGWDTEYRSKEWDIPIENQTEQANYNDVISYQYSAYSILNDRYEEGIIYLYNREDKTFAERWSLSEIIGEILKKLGITRYQSEQKVLNILLVSHFSVAEYTTLRDREKLNDKLSEVQKTFCSFKPFIQNVKWDSTHYTKINVVWKDTFLHGSSTKRSLEYLAKSIDMKKVEIPERYSKENLILLLEDDKILFEKYALEDAKIALSYYCVAMDKIYNNITDQMVERELITTSDSTVKYFVKWSEKQSKNIFGQEAKWLENKTFGIEARWRGKVKKSALRRIDESFACYSYLGGINTYYRSGRYQCNENEIALDIDISRAYPSAMATIPAIDWKQKPKTEFTINEIIKLSNEDSIKYSKVGIFLTKFDFPKNVYQSSIAQKTEGGLIYTNEGEDFCTWSELVEAIRLKGITDDEMIIRGNLYEELKINDKVYLPFAEYLGHLSKERDKWVKGSFENSYYKSMMCDLYGKLCQALEYREVFDLNGNKVPLSPSAITCAHYASQTTGIVRSVIEVLVNIFNEWEGCKVFNATTDGIMIVIPKPKDLIVEVWKEGDYHLNLKRNLSKENEEDKDLFGIVKNNLNIKNLVPELYEKLLTFYPIKLIIQGQKNLGIDNPEWLEIKNVGDEIRTEQTRANYIAYQGITQGLARGNVSKDYMENKDDFDRFTDSEETTQITLKSLSGIREIKDEKWDLVRKRIFNKKSEEWNQNIRTVNIGYDGKRVPIEEGLDSKQHQNINEWSEYRKVALNMKKKRQRIRIKDFLFRKNNLKNKNDKSLRVRGSRIETIIRVFLSAVWRFNWNLKELSYNELAEELNFVIKKDLKIESNEELIIRKKCISIDDLKNWKRRSFLAKSLPNVNNVKEIILEICNILKIEMNQLRWDKVLNLE